MEYTKALNPSTHVHHGRVRGQDTRASRRKDSSCLLAEWSDGTPKIWPKDWNFQPIVLIALGERGVQEGVLALIRGAKDIPEDHPSLNLTDGLQQCRSTRAMTVNNGHGPHQTTSLQSVPSVLKESRGFEDQRCLQRLTRGESKGNERVHRKLGLSRIGRTALLEHPKSHGG